MNVFFAADHAGLRMKAVLSERVALMGHTVVDKGAYDLDPNDDYPDVVIPLREAVASTPDSFGIICAGSGQGEAMCANRMSGIRAAVFYAPVSATEALDREGAHSQDGYDIVRLARKHNDANVLSIGARFVSLEEALEAVRIFLETPYSGDDRHTRRLNKFS